MGICQQGATTNVELAKDTPTAEAEHTHPADSQQTGSGSPQSPGGIGAKTQTTSEMSHGGEAYPGPRTGGETDKTGETPA